MAKTTEQKAQYIELRAEGKSYRQIAEALHISKSTCTEWARELYEDIELRKHERLQELYTLYELNKESRAKRISGTLQRIEQALAQKDLADLPVDKLLELKLKYEREARAEYMEPVELEPIDPLNFYNTMF